MLLVLVLPPLRPPLAAGRLLHAPPPPRARSLVAPSAAAAEFPGSVPEGAPMPPRRRRRSVAGVDQDELVDPDALADPDSSFYELNGIKIHHKICAHDQSEDPKTHSLDLTNATAGQIGLPIVLLHGFGASAFSWSRVMQPLARIAGAKVLAFDRPAFGLTARASWTGDNTKPLNPYSMAFSVMATLAFIDLLCARKAILIGHSAGCLVAVNAYFEAPERVAALVLVAPAIVAPVFGRKGSKKKGVRERERCREENDLDGDNAPRHPFVRVWRGIVGICMRIAGFLVKMMKALRDMVGSLYCKAVAAVLRSTFAVMLIRLIMDRFGILAVRNAFYDGSKVTDHIIKGYTKPLKAKGWEMALLEHTIAMITDSASTSRLPISKRLSEISCPVLVVTGDTDRLVPAWNAERVAQAIPDAALEVIKNCGHLPHEERVSEFLSVIERFLQRVFRAPNGELLHAAA